MYFCAKLIYQAWHGNKPSTFCEISIIILKSDSTEQAFTHATKFGKKSAYKSAGKNYLGQTIEWKFIAIADIQEISSKKLGDGTEVFYEFQEISKKHLEKLQDPHLHLKKYQKAKSYK